MLLVCTGSQWNAISVSLHNKMCWVSYTIQQNSEHLKDDCNPTNWIMEVPISPTANYIIIHVCTVCDIHVHMYKTRYEKVSP